MPPSAATFTYGYLDLAKLTNMATDTVYQHASRGEFDPERIDTVMLWLAKHGSDKLRIALMHALIRVDLKESNKRAATSRRKKAKRTE